MSSLQRLAIGVVVTLLVIFGIYRYGFHNGGSERDGEMQAEIAKKNEEARALEQRLIEHVNTSSKQLLEANHAIDQKQSDLDRAIRAGRVRLPAARCVPATQDAPAASGDRGQAPGQPDRAADQSADAERETLAAIAAIVADGDRAINQLNACIDAYNTVRSEVNGQR